MKLSQLVQQVAEMHAQGLCPADPELYGRGEDGVFFSASIAQAYKYGPPSGEPDFADEDLYENSDPGVFVELPEPVIVLSD